MELTPELKAELDWIKNQMATIQKELVEIKKREYTSTMDALGEFWKTFVPDTKTSQIMFLIKVNDEAKKWTNVSLVMKATFQKAIADLIQHILTHDKIE